MLRHAEIFSKSERGVVVRHSRRMFSYCITLSLEFSVDSNKT